MAITPDRQDRAEEMIQNINQSLNRKRDRKEGNGNILNDND